MSSKILISAVYFPFRRSVASFSVISKWLCIISFHFSSLQQWFTQCKNPAISSAFLYHFFLAIFAFWASPFLAALTRSAAISRCSVKSFSKQSAFHIPKIGVNSFAKSFGFCSSLFVTGSESPRSAAVLIMAKRVQYTCCPHNCRSLFIKQICCGVYWLHIFSCSPLSTVSLLLYGRAEITVHHFMQMNKRIRLAFSPTFSAFFTY